MKGKIVSLVCTMFFALSVLVLPVASTARAAEKGMTQEKQTEATTATKKKVVKHRKPKKTKAHKKSTSKSKSTKPKSTEPTMAPSKEELPK
jgi:hypothetical protein